MLQHFGDPPRMILLRLIGTGFPMRYAPLLRGDVRRPIWLRMIQFFRSLTVREFLESIPV